MLCLSRLQRCSVVYNFQEPASKGSSTGPFWPFVVQHLVQQKRPSQLHEYPAASLTTTDDHRDSSYARALKEVKIDAEAGRDSGAASGAN